MFAGGAGNDLEHVVWNLPMSFKIEVESTAEEALNATLALAIRKENSAQRVALFTEKSCPAMRRYIKRKQPWLDTVDATTATAK